MLVSVLVSGWEVDCCARGVEVGARFGGAVYVDFTQWRPVDRSAPLGLREFRRADVTGVGRAIRVTTGERAVDLGSGIIAGCFGEVSTGKFVFDGNLTLERHGPQPPELPWVEGLVTALWRRALVVEKQRVVGHGPFMPVDSTPRRPEGGSEEYLFELELLDDRS